MLFNKKKFKDKSKNIMKKVCYVCTQKSVKENWNMFKLGAIECSAVGDISAAPLNACYSHPLYDGYCTAQQSCTLYCRSVLYTVLQCSLVYCIVLQSCTLYCTAVLYTVLSCQSCILYCSAVFYTVQSTVHGTQYSTVLYTVLQ